MTVKCHSKLHPYIPITCNTLPKPERTRLSTLVTRPESFFKSTLNEEKCIL